MNNYNWAFGRKSRVDLEEIERLAQVVLQAEDPIITTSTEGKIETWNRAAERLFGYAAEEVLGRDETFLVERGNEHELHEIRMRVCRGEAYRTFSSQRVDAKGRLIEVALTAFPVIDSEGQVVALARIVRDTRALHSAEMALRERRAQDLRDRYVSTLFQLGLELDAIGRHVGSDEELRQHLGNSRGLMDAMLADLRSDEALLEISEPQGPPDLRHDIPQLAKNLLPASMTSVVNINAESLAAISAGLAEALFYVAQETLVNIVRHSAASRVGIDLRQQGGDISITIQDDGGGFDPAAMRPGLGITRMKSRVAALGGTFALYAIPGMGTTVRAQLPLEPD